MPLQVKRVQLKLKDGNEYKDGDLLFNVDAEAWATGKRNNQEVPTTDKTYLNNAKYYAEQASNTVFNGNLAPNYSTTSAYKIGDYVVYNTGLYECTTAIGTGGDGAFNSAHWRAVKVSQLNDTIVINDQPMDSTKIVVETTNEDVDLITAQDLENIIAEEFATNKAYAIGQYVLYNDNLYKFISAHSAGVWDSSQVTQVKISDEVTNINDQVDDLKTQLNQQTIFADKVFENGSNDYSLIYTNNAMNDNTGEQSSANPARASTPSLYYVPLGSDVYASNYNNTTYRPNIYCFDSSKTYLGKISSGNIVPSQKITLINGTVYVRFFVVYAGGTTDITPQEAAQAVTYTAVYAGRIDDELAEKQDILTFDNTPTNGSNNPVKSDGVFEADEAIRDSVGEIGEYSGLFREFDFADSVSGHFVASDNAYQDSASYSVSAPIEVASGETIVFHGRGYLTSVAMIAEYDSTAGTYRSLVPSVDSTVRVYTYTAAKDTTVVLSYRTEDTHICKMYNDVNEMVTDIIDDTIYKFTSNNFNFGFVDKNSSLLTAKPGYSASSAGWVETAGYNSWYFKATENCKIYPATTVLGYYAICIFNDSVSRSNYIIRYRQSDNNMPTKSDPLTVLKDQVVTITTLATDANFVLFYDKLPVLLGDQMVSEVNELINLSANKIKIEYSANQYLITSNGITFDFRHTVDETINQDCWRFVYVTKNGANLVNGDIIGVLLETGEADHIGGVHGDEKIVDFSIKADGVDITNATTYCDKVTIFMYSHLYRPSSPTTNVVDRYVSMTIENGVLTINNTFKCLVDNFKVSHAYNSGLLGIFKSNITFLSSNSDVADLTDMPADWNQSHDNIWYDIFLSNGSIHVENIIGHEQENYNASVHYFSNENPQRLKIYMNTDENATWNTGHICNGKFSYTFQ